jgi:hypothetical protein
MSLKDDAARAAVLKALLDAVTAEYKAVNARVSARLLEEKQRTGTKQIAAEIDGTPVASIAWITPEATPSVADPAAFAAWVAKHHPHQVEREFVTTVRPAFAKAILAEVEAAGRPQWCDKETGELHDVPGIKFIGKAAHARLSFRKSGGREVGREQIAAAWRAGHLSLPLPELEAGGE